jgi:NADH-quinone oxidoreductase subunit L
MLWLAFAKKFRGTEEQSHHLHESPATMTIPLLILALLAAFGAMINIPEVFGGNSWLNGFLAPVFADATHFATSPEPVSHAVEWLLMGVTLAGCLLMILWTYHRFVKQDHGLLPDDAPRSVPVTLLSRKYYIDELYYFVIERPIYWCSRIFHEIIEIRFIDRLVNGLGSMVVWTGSTVRYIQTGNVGFYMFIMILGIIFILFFNILI